MTTDTRTIGVAIAIPEPWGDDLQEQRAGYGDRLAWTIPTHVTLLPPTQVPKGRLREIDEHLRRVAQDVDPFLLELGPAETFRPVTPTVFLGLVAGREAVTGLEGQVRSGPLKRRLTFPYHPHVTLAFDVDDAALDQAMSDYAAFHASFTVTHLSRYELVEDGIWLPERDFALGER